MLNKKWSDIVNSITFDSQPIVNIKTGKTYGIEVLLRGYKEAGGFYSIANFFDEAFNDGVLYQLDLELRIKAIEEFTKIDTPNLRLFYNLDYRIMNMPDFTSNNTQKIFTKFNLDKNFIYFEITEKTSLKDPSIARNLSNRYKQEGYNIVIDNFGSGVSGFQLLYYPSCDFIKLDRFFINDISTSHKKRLFFSSIINMAHTMNIKVIASCVESIEEYYVCKDLGVDFIQGNFIQEPIRINEDIPQSFQNIKELYKNDKRSDESNTIDKSKITKIKSLNIKSTLEELFLYFKQNPENSFAPVVDNYNSIMGAVFEKDIKKISYSQYGMSLAKNTNIDTSLEKYLKPIVSAEITWSVDKILNIYNTNKHNDTGIFITKNNEYHGFIDLNNLLDISYKRTIQVALDKNPLTKLPGNSQIDQYISKAFNNESALQYFIIYFDFNDFKPFNDSYGFRQGDRAISMFANILKKRIIPISNSFIGHIGGDDFFVGLSEIPYKKVHTLMESIQKSFSFEASSLYSQKDRANGYIKTQDRFQNIRKFPLLAVACAIIEINKNISKKDFDEILYDVKKASKNSDIPVGISLQ